MGLQAGGHRSILLIEELRVDGRAQIQPTYRLVTPEVCATSERVERTAEERLRLLRLALGEDAIELVGDGREIGRRRPASGLVRRREREFGLLGAEVLEPRLEPREPLVAALGGELALLKGLVVALERLLGSGDLGAERRQPRRQKLELGLPTQSSRGRRRSRSH